MTHYWAQVKIANHNPLGRLDNWKLSWDWMRDEFIYTMKGAYLYVADSSDCIFGRQAQYYKNLDFSNVLNCERRPTLIDLPLEKSNDTTLGMIPFCCRNGTILPPTMDASKSISAFQINVFKMPPDMNRSRLSPPQNWKIKGTLNPDYKCGPPVRVSPSQFPNPSGLASNRTAFASWQVVCNISQPKGEKPKCCVSFSAFYNASVIPCKTCACGCQNNCGVSINWHLFTDYSHAWTARITIFNWDDISFADWFAAVEMEKAAPGFEKAYSFNGSSMRLSGVNNTIFMRELPGLNYLVAQSDGADPQKYARVPGKQQSVISFTKKNTLGINVAMGDGFPSKVSFNGEECALPTALPASNSHRKVSIRSISGFLAVYLFVLTQQ
ncbi:hypothetical protein NMG60_11025028 [Bertholletia excelsa]